MDDDRRGALARDMTDVVIEKLTVPTGPEDLSWPDLVAMNTLVNDTLFELEGDRGLSLTPEARVESLQPDPASARTAFVAKRAGTVIGYAFHRRVLREGAHESFATLGVDPTERRQGIATRLFAEVLADVRAAGSTTIQSYVIHSYPDAVDGATDTDTDTDTEMLPVEGGQGEVPAHNPETLFAQGLGFRLVQANVGSELLVPVPAERLAQLEAEIPASASAYELRTWEAPTPKEYLADLAILRTRMSTDAPTGGMVGGEDPWDVERVRHEEQVRTMGHGRIYAGAVHRETGHLVAFTEIDLANDPIDPASQQYTLVLREHRGHGLGMLVKIANLRRLAEVSPQTPSIKTFNADENDAMLRINRALGFRAVNVSGSWRLDL